MLTVWTCVDIMTGVASILNLTLVTVFRLVNIKQPLKKNSSKLVSRQGVLVALFLIWIFSFTIALAKGIFNKFWFKTKPSYETLIVVAGFFIPMLIIVYCYIEIYKVVRTQIKFISQSSRRCSECREKTDLKAIKTIAIVVLAFFICWCPFFVLNLYNGWCQFKHGPLNNKCYINKSIMIAAKWLHYANSSLNPIIYACFNREFRFGFKMSLYKYLSTKDVNEGGFSSMLKRASIKSVLYEVNGVQNEAPHFPIAQKFLKNGPKSVLLTTK